MDPEGIMLSEISQKEKSKYCYDLAYMWNIKKPKFIRNRDQICDF